MFIWKFNHENPSPRSWVGLKGKVTYLVKQPTNILFVPCQSALPFLGYGYFTIWPWKSKVKIIVQGHIVSPTPYIYICYIYKYIYWLTSVSFHVNWTSYSWYTAFLKFDLENPKSRSQWGQSSKLQSGSNLLSTHIPFILCQLVNWSSNSWDMAFSKFDLENLRSKSYLKITYCSSAVQRRSPNATHKWNGQPISAQWMVRFATNEFLTCFSQFNNCMWFGKILQSF